MWQINGTLLLLLLLLLLQCGCALDVELLVL